MIFKRLKLKNFLIYKEADIDLSSIKLASIIGQHASDRRRSNGAGKTAFLESIRYALYDQTRGKLKQSVVKVGESTCIVELEFDIDGKQVRVWRQRLADATSSAQLFIDGKLAGDKIKIVNEALQQLIGIDIDLFDSIYFFKQGDHFSFAEANPTDRKNALAKVFRMDVLNKCADNAKKRRSLKESDLARVKGAVEVLGSQLNSGTPYQTLVEQELAITGELATAKHLEADRAAIHADDALHLSSLDDSYNAFLGVIKDDMDAISNIHNSIQDTTNAIAARQASIQKDQSKLSQFNKTLEDDLAKIDEFDDVDIDSERTRLEAEIKLLDQKNKVAIGEFYTAQAELKLLDNRKIAFTAGATCPTCRQFITAEHYEACNSEAARSATSLNAKMESSRDVRTKLEKKISDAKARLDRLGTVKSLRENIAFYDNNIADIKHSIKNAESDIEQLTSQRNELFQNQLAAKARTNDKLVASYRNSIDSSYAAASGMLKHSWQRQQLLYRSDIERLSREQSTIAKSIKDTKEKQKQYDDASAKLKLLESECYVYDKLSEIFGRNGIQAIMIENAIGMIESFANDILRQLQTRFLVSLRTVKETKAGDLRESLDIIVFDNGSEKAFENYSGGEKALINIALRLSLSRVISAMHGVKMQSLFLDEVLGALDGPNRVEVVRILSYLSRSFDQVFVVSHTDEIQDVIDSSIVIERHDNHSEIKLTHGRS